MNLTQLKVFTEVMKTGSISKTAVLLHRTQPAISLSIRNLEDSIGFKLFERQGRQLVAVPEAYYFLEEAQGILKRVSTIERTLHSMQNAEIGSLRIAAMPGPATYLFPRFISRSIGENPNIKVTLFAHSSNQVHELAATQSIDFGFADAANLSGEASQYAIEKISADCFVALPQNHPLTQKKVISVTDLDSIPIGGLMKQHINTKRIINLFEEQGLLFNQIVDSQTFLPAFQFVSAGQCVAITDPLTMVTELKMDSSHGKVVFRPLKEHLRYDYAVLSSNFRPLSRLAKKLKDDWKIELHRLLEEINANPTNDN
ncbi:LysR family transcriptional regulator [Cocleimonas sp. KMM 6892]|uniref:LysR family transcriptional regulator n=1 Tax=unclassified Cocleimonas TaxID=2639732 RepID=UPI002DB792AE|nr:MULTISPECIES: LysR family transcriptional regulator [unclassified Cocleimonas]MEB8433408.1 LysR family transcriptional regulator [Cocleimonas sp. KMM 6892]MEC4716219.1 LysR family transcriptional regulator [Cocleimonas sp. KMM 6895]MEC4745888.1 LysR family transcriptional regulator [Cocleimonas sp. KMM 6896]